MTTDDRVRWDRKYSALHPAASISVDDWLVESLRVIDAESGSAKERRQALDLACGLGVNAIWLAQQGWQVDAVDISATGLKHARQTARNNRVDIGWIEADLDDWQPATGRYDLVLVFRFLDRASVPRVVRSGLRPAGWLIYETFAAAQCGRSDNHLHNPAFTLAPGELASLFPEFQVVAHRRDVLSSRTVERFLGRRVSGT